MLFRCASLVIFGSLALAACGGGGGAGSSVPPASAAAPFSIASYSSVATPAASTLISVASSGNVLDALSAQSSSGPSALIRGDAVGIARWAVSNWTSANRERPAATESFSDFCNWSGSFSGSINDRDNNGDLSAGDSLSLTFTNCRFAEGDLPVSGSYALTVNSVTFNQFGDIATASFNTTFTNLGTAGNLLNGSVSMQINALTDSYTASYSNFTSSRGAATPTVVNVTVSANASQVSVSGTMTVNNNTYTLSTPSALIFGLTYPTSGTFRITDAAGGRIDFVTVDSVLYFDLYLPGDLIRDARTTTTWAALDSL